MNLEAFYLLLFWDLKDTKVKKGLNLVQDFLSGVCWDRSFPATCQRELKVLVSATDIFIFLFLKM